MPRTNANGVEIEYETFGDPAQVPIVLLSGGGAQLTFWQEPFCEDLASRGFCVVRMDNRDAGLSTSFEAAGVPNVPANFAIMAAAEAPAKYVIEVQR